MAPGDDDYGTGDAAGREISETELTPPSAISASSVSVSGTKPAAVRLVLSRMGRAAQNIRPGKGP